VIDCVYKTTASTSGEVGKDSMWLTNMDREERVVRGSKECGSTASSLRLHLTGCIKWHLSIFIVLADDSQVALRMGMASLDGTVARHSGCTQGGSLEGSAYARVG
jgi:hypothetical protein